MLFVSVFFAVVMGLGCFVRIAMELDGLTLGTDKAFLEFAIICAITLSLAIYISDE